MKTHFSKVAIFLFGLALFVGCKPPDDQFSEIPYVEWRDQEIQVIGNPADNRRSIVLKVYFNDRDGDIGTDRISPVDTCDLANYNLLIRYFEKVGGTYQEIPPADSCQPFHNILPNLTPEGQNKVLEGEIDVAFSYLAFPKNNGVDSVKFEVQLRDRAYHVSNIAYSPAIFIPQ